MKKYIRETILKTIKQGLEKECMKEIRNFTITVMQDDDDNLTIDFWNNIPYGMCEDHLHLVDNG